MENFEFGSLFDNLKLRDFLTPNFQGVNISPITTQSLLNFTAGLNQAAAQTPDMTRAFGLGTQAASQGLVNNLNQSIEAQANQNLAQQENQLRRNQMQTIMNDNITSLGQKALAMIASGDPTIAKIGGTLLSSAQRARPKPLEWREVTRNIGGVDRPVLQNIYTGEIRPYAAEMYRDQKPPKVNWIESLGGWYDEFGNPAPAQAQTAAAPTTAGTAQTATAPAGSILAGATPSTQLEQVQAQAQLSGLTPSEQRKVQMSQFESQQKVLQSRAEAETKAQVESETKAREFISPDNILNLTNKFDTNKQLISQIGQDIKEFNNTFLPDFPTVKRARTEFFGSSSGSRLQQNVNKLFLGTLEQMSQSGVNPTKLADASKEGERILATVLDVNAPEDAQINAFNQLKEWQDKQINLVNEQLKSNYTRLGQPVPQDLVNQFNSLKFNRIVNYGGKKYRVSTDINGRTVNLGEIKE